MKMREDYVAKLTADTEKHLENLYQASESLRKGREGGGAFAEAARATGGRGQ